MAKRCALRDAEGFITEFEGRPTVRGSQVPAKKDNRLNHVIQLRGCNGSGKSTVPMQMLAADPDHIYVTTDPSDRKPVATWLPRFNALLVGTYLPGTNCGGCDSVPGPQAVYKILREFWNTDPDIIFEGVIIGDNKIQTYNALVDMRRAAPGREIHFVLVDTPLDVCLERIAIRNGGKEFQPRLVDKKFRAQQRYWAFLTAQDDVDCWALSTKGSKQEVFFRFLQKWVDWNTNPPHPIVPAYYEPVQNSTSS